RNWINATHEFCELNEGMLWRFGFWSNIYPGYNYKDVSNKYKECLLKCKLQVITTPLGWDMPKCAAMIIIFFLIDLDLFSVEIALDDYSSKMHSAACHILPTLECGFGSTAIFLHLYILKGKTNHSITSKYVTFYLIQNCKPFGINIQILKEKVNGLVISKN
ncbi:hypothetical protein ACJX0J_013376, partial [Zea mays]